MDAATSGEMQKSTGCLKRLTTNSNKYAVCSQSCEQDTGYWMLVLYAYVQSSNPMPSSPSSLSGLHSATEVNVKVTMSLAIRLDIWLSGIALLLQLHRSVRQCMCLAV